MAKLFEGFPDEGRVASDAALGVNETQGLLLELAWVTKTITRLGKGYLLGDHGFARPDSTADRELSAVDASDGDFDSSWHTAWVSPDELSATLSDRTGVDVDVTDAVVNSVIDQLDEEGGRGMRVATKLLDLERVVEDQLIEDPSVLDIWGWGLSEVQRQVRLDARNRADIVGRRSDGTWVVVELKRGAALAETADQILRYLPLVRDQFAEGGPVAGLVIADGDDDEFHDRVLGVPEPISYLPTRCLNLPACRPQSHRMTSGEVVVAADGITVVGASPSATLFDILEPVDLWSAGRRLLDGTHLPTPVTPLEPSTK